MEGRRAFALRAALEQMQSLDTAGSVRLLPLFDAYALGLAHDIEPILPNVYKRQVFRLQGWISAVVLVDRYIKGVWEYTIRGSQTVVKVRMFASPAAPVRRGIEAEAERLGAFLNTQVELVYE